MVNSYISSITRDVNTWIGDTIGGLYAGLQQVSTSKTFVRHRHTSLRGVRVFSKRFSETLLGILVTSSAASTGCFWSLATYITALPVLCFL